MTLRSTTDGISIQYIEAGTNEYRLVTLYEDGRHEKTPLPLPDICELLVQKKLHRASGDRIWPRDGSTLLYLVKFGYLIQPH